MHTGKKMAAKLAMVTAAALLMAVSAFALDLPGFGKGEKVSAANGAVSIPVAKVWDGKAHFYRFADGGKEIRFFLVKGTDGALHSAFDTCDVCYREKKGYDQEGVSMQCKNCGKKFAINKIGPHTVGGCNPTYLPMTQSAGKAVITVNDLKAGAKFF